MTVADEAKLPPALGRRFHRLRRKFATEMRHAPLRDLAYLGWWKSVSTMVEVYHRPGAETMQRALAKHRPSENQWCQHQLKIGCPAMLVIADRSGP